MRFTHLRNIKLRDQNHRREVSILHNQTTHRNVRRDDVANARDALICVVRVRLYIYIC